LPSRTSDRLPDIISARVRATVRPSPIDPDGAEAASRR
jgi:hypothetical protein